MSTHTCNDLIAEVEALFNCEVGDPMRYVFSEDESKYTEPYTYKVLMYVAKGRSEERAQLLRDILLGDFQTLAAVAGEGATLYWRHLDKIQEEQLPSGEVSIRARIAIPALSQWPIESLKLEGMPAQEVA